MVNSLTVEQTIEMLKQVCSAIIAKQEELNEIDRAIGDGDHGSSMSRGFESVLELLKSEHSNNLSTLFQSVGNNLISSIGGSAGIIFGTLFRSGSKAFLNCENFNSTVFANFLNLGEEAITKRGGAHPGDKTMVDALHSAAITAALNSEVPLDQFLSRIAEAAREGMENTKTMKAAFGRAKTFSDRSLGLPDPGAVTTYLILKEMSEYVINLSAN
jgi:phosphoenolpyruvate---glycerone phosphotransferase subunit DhaL